MNAAIRPGAIVMTKHPIGTSANNKAVYAYLTSGAVGSCIARNPHLLSLVQEVVKQRNLKQQVVIIEHDTGRIIGHSDRVATEEGDQIFYATAPKSVKYLRFVKNRKSEQTSLLTLKLQLDDADEYELQEVLIGQFTPPLPSEANALAWHHRYWETHAYVYNGQPLLASSITKNWPY